MKTKSIPAIIMLTAGLVACIAGIAEHMEAVHFTKMLLIVLILFYVLGCVVKMILDWGFKQVKKEETTDGEEEAAAEEGEAAVKEEQEEK